MSLKSPEGVPKVPSMCRRQGLNSQTMAGVPSYISLHLPASGLRWYLGVCELAGESPLQTQGIVSGRWCARHLGPWGWRQAQRRGESGRVIVYIEARVVLALRARGSMPPGPPLLGLLPLAAGDDREEVDEEDLNDLNDTDDRAAHPQAQLATKVG